ncbi:MAG: tRNA pseudouridine(38-40) synthase TruA [Bacteroidia bacterium]
MALTRYFLRLSYNGSSFCGWQFQPGVETVQETLCTKIGMLLREKIDVVGCGRTDSGVHASKYYAHFDSEHTDLDTDEKVLFRLNKILPKAIAIQEIKKMPDNAHARFAATSRSYEYHITRVKNSFGPDLAWELHEPLNVVEMNKAAQALLDYQDFASFCKAGGNSKTTICHLKEAIWKEEGNKLVFHITSNRFLRNMVRAIVGTLVDVGRGKLTVAQVHEIVQSKKRSQAGMSVPPQGLFLTDIQYPSHLGLS